MSLEFLITALIVVLVPGTGVVYTVAVGLGKGRLASAGGRLRLHLRHSCRPSWPPSSACPP
jgi:hypothetical protein